MKVRACVMLGVLSVVSTLEAQTRAGTVNVGDAQLHYEVAGTGPVLVFVNGWALNMRAWDDQVAAFSPRYQVIRYDARGFHKSTGAADRSADPDDLRILLDSLGVRTASVVGLSRGSLVAADFAVRWPERVSALVLYAMGPPSDFPMPPGRAIPNFSLIARAHGLDSVFRSIAASPLAWRPPDRPEADQRVARAMEGYDGRDLLDPKPESGRVKGATVEELARLRVPTLILHGDHELPLMRTVADSLAKRIPGAKRVIIVDGGHGAHFAQPEAFNRELEAFLRSARR